MTRYTAPVKDMQFLLQDVVKVTEANLTYVAIDKTGKPRLVAP